MNFASKRTRSAVVGLLALGGCIGNIGDGDPNSSDPVNDPGAAPEVFFCDPDLAQSPSPMRRLSHRQYVNTLDDLVASVHGPTETAAIIAALDAALSLLPADRSDDYRRFDQNGSQLHVEANYEVAIRLGVELTASAARIDALAGACATDNDATNDAACVYDFVASFGLTALRRPLTEEEIAFYSADALDDVTSVSADSFAERVTVMVLAPEFSYQIEDELPVDGDGAYSLSGFELASRLSYHFWDSMPDAELLAAAADGSLDTEAGYAAQVGRLVNDARAQVVIDSFFREWLRLEDLPPMDAAVGTPSYDTLVGSDVPSASLTDDMAQEVVDLFDHYVWDVDGSLDDVLLSDLSFARTPELATIYGVAAYDGETPPILNPNERSGLLTRAAMVATGAIKTQPVIKGVVIRRRLLCENLPDPPADIGEPPELSPDMTTREHFEELTMQPGSSCIGCHGSINPLGFVTENYDPIGRFRTEEMIFGEDEMLLTTKPVDTQATVIIGGNEMAIEDGVELSELVALSDKADQCIARNYYRFAYGHAEDLSADGCTLQTVHQALRGTGSLKDMLASIALDTSFKTRRVEK